MNKSVCSLPKLLNILMTAQSHIKGKGKEGVLIVALSSSQKKPKSRKKKRKVLEVRKDVGKTELKGKEVVGKGNCYCY